MGADKPHMKEGCYENMSDMEKMDGTQAAQASAPAPESQKPAKEEKAAKADKSEKKDKSAKKEKDKKPGFFARAGRWFREMKSELKKVSWPSAKDTMKNVGTVILCVVIVGVVIALFDTLVKAVIDALLNLF